MSPRHSETVSTFARRSIGVNTWCWSGNIEGQQLWKDKNVQHSFFPFQSKFARRELAVQLRRDVIPNTDSKVFLVAIGTAERARDFVATTGFPAEQLFADPENAAYDALGLYKGAQRTFFSWKVREPTFYAAHQMHHYINQVSWKTFVMDVARGSACMLD